MLDKNRCDYGELLSYDEALRQLTADISALAQVAQKPLKDALGKVLAETVRAQIDVPGTAMSAMDGYAVNSADIAAHGETRLTVSQRIAAGNAAQALQPGTAARIFTGAPIPEGAEDIGQAASVGLQTLPVFEAVKVGIFFTGDELIEPGVTLSPGKIYDSNRYTLYGLLAAMGCEIIDLGLVGDTLEATRQAMLAASAEADLVVTTGGVSVGEEDHVRIALEQLGELRLWRLGIKPGKPLAFGQIGSAAFIGLPGNPVSVFATFCLFVAPVLQLMQGRDWHKPKPIPVTAGFDWLKSDSRREFLRARLEVDAAGETVAQIFPNQDSAVLTSTVWAEGFIEIAENSTVNRGDKVDYLPFNQLLG